MFYNNLDITMNALKEYLYYMESLITKFVTQVDYSQVTLSSSHVEQIINGVIAFVEPDVAATATNIDELRPRNCAAEKAIFMEFEDIKLECLRNDGFYSAGARVWLDDHHDAHRVIRYLLAPVNETALSDDDISDFMGRFKIGSLVGPDSYNLFYQQWVTLERAKKPRDPLPMYRLSGSDDISVLEMHKLVNTTHHSEVWPEVSTELASWKTHSDWMDVQIQLIGDLGLLPIDEEDDEDMVRTEPDVLSDGAMDEIVRLADQANLVRNFK
jgi:hypothetical protein